MNSASDLPADVISAIQANHKIKAIKLLREARGLGLKEAKHAVEAYARAKPMPLQPESSANILGLIVFLLLAGYVAYQIID